MPILNQPRLTILPEPCVLIIKLYDKEIVKINEVEKVKIADNSQSA